MNNPMAQVHTHTKNKKNKTVQDRHSDDFGLRSPVIFRNRFSGIEGATSIVERVGRERERERERERRSTAGAAYRSPNPLMEGDQCTET